MIIDKKDLKQGRLSLIVSKLFGYRKGLGKEKGGIRGREKES